MKQLLIYIYKTICASVKYINIVFLTYNKYMFSKLHVNQYKAHSVLLKLLCFNFKLFTQRSRMLRLNWMHFLHFCKQKYRIKLLHCAGYYQNEKVMREIEVPTANMFSLHHLQYSPETFCNYHVLVFNNRSQLFLYILFYNHIDRLTVVNLVFAITLNSNQ